MIGFVFTSTEEATHFANTYTSGRFDAIEEGTPIQLNDDLLLATGPGKIKAALATERLLDAYDVEVLLHGGTCSSLTDEISAGTLVGVSFVLEGDRVELDAPTYPRMPLEHPFDTPTEGTLVSQDHVPEEPDEKSYWARIADVRDSTGYAVAYVSAQHGTPCHIAKVVVEKSSEASASPPKGRQNAYETMTNFLIGLARERKETE